MPWQYCLRLPRSRSNASGCSSGDACEPPRGDTVTSDYTNNGPIKIDWNAAINTLMCKSWKMEVPAMYHDKSRTVSASAHPVGAASTAAAIDPVAHRVLRDTYRLLSATLAFSALVAAGTATLGLPHPGILLTLGGYFGLLFLTSYLRNSAWGLLSVFALTGFMGYTLGPLLAAYLSLPNGTSMVVTAMGATAFVFLGLSWYARSESAVDMSRYTSFLMIGILAAFGLGLAAYFFSMPALSLAVSGMFVLL